MYFEHALSECLQACELHFTLALPRTTRSGLNTALYPHDYGHRNVTITGNTIYAEGSRRTPARWGKNTTGRGKHGIAVQSGNLLSIRGNTLYNFTDLMFDMDLCCGNTTLAEMNDRTAADIKKRRGSRRPLTQAHWLSPSPGEFAA